MPPTTAIRLMVRPARSTAAGRDGHVRPDTVRHAETEPAVQYVDEGRRAVGFPVVDVHDVRRRCGAVDPVGEIGLIGVGRQCDRADLGPHRVVVAEQLDLTGARAQRIAAGAGCLEPDEQHLVAVVADAAGEVVDHPTAGGHAGCGDDDHRAASRVQLLGSLDGSRLGQLDRTEQLVAVELGSDFRGTVAGFRPVDVEGSARHRTVDEDRQVRDVTRPDESVEVPEHDLGAVDGERRDEHHTTVPGGAVDHLGDTFLGVALGMVLVAVRRLGDDDVGGADRRRREEERMRGSPEISAEGHAGVMVGEVQPDRGRAQNVAGSMPRRLHRRQNLMAVVEPDGFELIETRHRVCLGVERERRVMLGGAVPVGEIGLFLLEVAAVRKHDLGQLAGAFGAVDGATEPPVDDPRDVPAVIDVGMGQHDRVNALRWDRERRPVLEAQALRTLEQSAIDQHPTGGSLEQRLAAGHGLSTSDERQRRGGDRFTHTCSLCRSRSGDYRRRSRRGPSLGHDDPLPSSRTLRNRGSGSREPRGHAGPGSRKPLRLR